MDQKKVHHGGTKVMKRTREKNKRERKRVSIIYFLMHENHVGRPHLSKDVSSS